METELKEIINGFLEICQYLCGTILMLMGIYKILTNNDIYDSMLWIIFGISLINNARIVSVDNKLDTLTP